MDRMVATRYAYDPALLPLIERLPTAIDFGDPEALAQMRGPRPEIFGTPPPDREDVAKRDLAVPGSAGDPDVPIRIYTPRAGASGPRGCVFEIHGGGFIMGDVAMMDPWCQVVAAELDAIVVSVEYRLAPEHPFPAGIEDCYAALCWTAANAKQLGADPRRLAIAGQSAGGGLAAGTALLARDRGGPELCFQLLDIPELDDRLGTPSMRAFTDTPLWNRPNAEWSWRHYLGGRGGEVSPYAAPARMKDLSNLPPAYVSTMEFDPLRDEGILYALRMLQAGVPVELHSYPGTFHGSSLIAGAAISQRCARDVLDALRRALTR
jgi:acetyl esterase/lipase